MTTNFLSVEMYTNWDIYIRSGLEDYSHHGVMNNMFIMVERLNGIGLIGIGHFHAC